MDGNRYPRADPNPDVNIRDDADLDAFPNLDDCDGRLGQRDNQHDFHDLCQLLRIRRVVGIGFDGKLVRCHCGWFLNGLYAVYRDRDDQHRLRYPDESDRFRLDDRPGIGLGNGKHGLGNVELRSVVVRERKQSVELAESDGHPDADPDRRRHRLDDDLGERIVSDRLRLGELGGHHDLDGLLRQHRPRRVE